MANMRKLIMKMTPDHNIGNKFKVIPSSWELICMHQTVLLNPDTKKVIIKDFDLGIRQKDIK
jgi:hypothetical protein